MAGLIAEPSTHRQSLRLKRSKKIMEELQGSSSQPRELNNSKEEEQPPQLEGASPRTEEEQELEGEIRYSDEDEVSHHTSSEKQPSTEREVRYSDEEEAEGEIRYSDEEEIEGNSEAEEAEGEIRYSDEEEGIYHTCVGEEDNRSSSEHETKPTENVNVSPSQEDQLAQILANMTEYARPHSPLNLNIDINQLPEDSAIDREIIGEELNETAKPSEARVASSERYEQEEENIESIPQLGTPQGITESAEEMIPEESIREHENME